MAEPTIELAFTLEELGLLWDALTHKDLYHRELAASIEAQRRAGGTRPLALNTQMIVKINRLSERLNEAIRQAQPELQDDQAHASTNPCGLTPVWWTQSLGCFRRMGQPLVILSRGEIAQ